MDASAVSSRCQTLRALGPMVEEAFNTLYVNENVPETAEIEAVYRRLEARLDQLAQDVWATPAQSWQDIVERAELAYAFSDEELSRHLNSDCSAIRAFAELVMSILALSGGEAWRRNS